ncbi:MAG: hypothetical protein ACYTHM_04475 [Planctomycetota bacterium]|jgi:hypothetical protein
MMMKRASKDSGVILLLMLMVLSILIVVVGQFSTTAVLGWQIARNREREVQLALDTRAGTEGVLLALAARGEEEEESFRVGLDRDVGEVEAWVEDETGKFNVNALLNPPKGISTARAEAVLRRLLDLADDPPGTLPAGCADAVVSLIREGDTPLPTLGALLAVEGMTPEALYGEEGELEGGAGLSRLLTVWGDGRIRPGVGDDRVMLALSQRMTPAILASALAYIRNPTPNPPPQVANLAQDVLPWTTWKSQAFSADIVARREGAAKRTRVALAVEGQGFRVVCHDELR